MHDIYDGPPHLSSSRRYIARIGFGAKRDKSSKVTFYLLFLSNLISLTCSSPDGRQIFKTIEQRYCLDTRSTINKTLEYNGLYLKDA